MKSIRDISTSSKIIFVLLFLSAIGFIIFALGPNAEERKAEKNKITDVDYVMLFNAPNQYFDHYVRISGRVSDIGSEEFVDFLTIEEGLGVNFANVPNCIYMKTERSVKLRDIEAGDYVVVVGKVGRHTGVSGMLNILECRIEKSGNDAKIYYDKTKNE